MNPSIKWTKTYAVHHVKGSFRAFTSEHEGRHFYATLLFFERKQAFSLLDGDKGVLDFKHQTFYGTSESQALHELKAWLCQQLPGKYEFQDEST